MSKKYEVYAILNESLHPDTGRPTIKLGFTDDIRERIKKLQTGCAVELKYVNRIYVPQHLMVNEEEKAHDYFADYRLAGEHFDITEEDVKEYFSTRQKEYQQTEGINGEIVLYKRHHDTIRSGIPCFFYPEHRAQDKFGPKSKEVITGIKNTTRYRWMVWPNVDESHPSYAGKDKHGNSRVYISGKKHDENLQLMQHENSKKNQSNLESFFI
tara:strand:- start:101 stop:736 length:636 start_codon:yes stop_codon:yes gene_type:complete